MYLISEATLALLYWEFFHFWIKIRFESWSISSGCFLNVVRLNVHNRFVDVFRDHCHCLMSQHWNHKKRNRTHILQQSISDRPENLRPAVRFQGIFYQVGLSIGYHQISHIFFVNCLWNKCMNIQQSIDVNSIFCILDSNYLLSSIRICSLLLKWILRLSSRNYR